MMKIRAIASSQDEALKMMGVSADSAKLADQSLADFGDSPWYETYHFTFEVSQFTGDTQYLVNENCEAEYQNALNEYNRLANEAGNYIGLKHPRYEDYCC